MEHAGANDQIEGASELAYILDLKLMEIEVVQRVFLLQLARMTEAFLADVDGGDMRGGLAKRVARGLASPLSLTAMENSS
jgi:hypothetical protein